MRISNISLTFNALSKRLAAILRMETDMTGFTVVNRLHTIARQSMADGVTHVRCGQSALNILNTVSKTEPAPQHPAIGRLWKGRKDTQTQALNLEFIPVKTGQTFHEVLGHAIQAVGSNRAVRINLVT